MSNLNMTPSRPFNQVIRIVDAKNIWSDINDLEIKSQFRRGNKPSFSLIAELDPFMTKAFDANDLVITWSMTGEDTRTLCAEKWGALNTGYFNIVISDIGDTDARALVVPTIAIVMDTTNVTVEDS